MFQSPTFNYTIHRYAYSISSLTWPLTFKLIGPNDPRVNRYDDLGLVFAAVTRLALAQTQTLSLEWRLLRTFFANERHYHDDLQAIIRQMSALDHMKTVCLWFQGSHDAALRFLNQGFRKVIRDHYNACFRIDRIAEVDDGPIEHQGYHVFQVPSTNIFERQTHEMVCPWVPLRMEYGQDHTWMERKVVYSPIFK